MLNPSNFQTFPRHARKNIGLRFFRHSRAFPLGGRQEDQTRTLFGKQN
jgi:hypothetical protein